MITRLLAAIFGRAQWNAGLALQTDDFNRADGALGAAWATLAGTLSVASNQCTGAAVAADHIARRTGVFTDNQFAQCEFISAPAANERYAGLVVRAAAGAVTCYGVSLRSDGAGGSGIYRYSAGTPTLLAALGGASSFASGDILRLEAQGTTIRLLKNGAQILSTTDATIASGNPGLDLYAAAIVDNWQGGDL